jgi:hypothetical protein
MVYEMKKADKSKNEKYVGSRVWSYVMLPGHPSYDRTVWKLDQLLLATGLATTKKRKGSFDPDEMVGEEVVVNIRPDKNLNDEYRGQIGAVMAYDEETFGQEADDDGDEDEEDLDEEIEEEEEEEEEVEEDEEDDEEDEDEEDEEDEEEAGDDEAENYSEWSIADLRAELQERDLNSRGPKPKLIERLEEDDGSGDEDEEDEEEEEEEPAPKPAARKRKSTAKAKSTGKKPTASKRSTAKRSGGRKGKSGDYPFDDE